MTTPPADRRPQATSTRRRTRRPTLAGATIGLLVALLGFALVVQVRGNTVEAQLATARPEDLARILADLDARQARLRQEITDLENSRRELESGVRGGQAALDEARRQADDLGILAGTLPARGPGLAVRFQPGREPVRAVTLLDAVEELRGAGAEAMQVVGGDGTAVRVVASTYFIDTSTGLSVGGTTLPAPFAIHAIGEPRTLRSALDIPGGVVDSLRPAGGTVEIEERQNLLVSATYRPTESRYARPAR